MTAQEAEKAARLEIEELETPGRGFRFHLFFALVAGFWRGNTRRTAWVLTCALLASVLLNIALQYSINLWNKYFFDAIGQKDVQTVWFAVAIFAGLAGAAIIAMAFTVYVRMGIQARWRRWLTGKLATQWLHDRQFYKLHIAAPEVDNPEFRMTDDVRQAIDPLVDFALGILNALLMAAVFASVLWHVGGNINLFGVVIPGYFLVVAALYGLCASLLTYLIGRPLIKSTEEKNAAEAKNRFELVRIRENAESIAMIGGAEDELTQVSSTLRDVLSRWKTVIRQQSFITLIIHGNTMFSPVLPLLIGAPKYLGGQMSLGDLMQVSAAFLQVQLAFNWLVENFFRIAEWSASVRRIVELSVTLHSFSDTDDASSEIEVSEGEDARLKLINLSVSYHSGRTMIKDAEMVIEPGEKILIRGQSGTGKSTLIRAIAGLWPWGKGRIVMPRKSRVIFVPQRPYIPNGSLRAALSYPDAATGYTDEKMKQSLRRCGLRHLADALEREEHWDKRLSGGEQQRLAFARLLVHRPEVIVLDEATSALDEDGQADLMSLFLEDLSYATLISVGHRPGLEYYHDRVIELNRRSTGAHVSEKFDGSRRMARLIRELVSPRSPISPKN